MNHPGGSRIARDRFLRRAVITTLGTRAVSTAGLLLLTPLLTHRLGLEKYGVLMTLTAAASVLGLGNFGIANGLISKIATVGWESDRTRILLSAASVLLVGASVLATGIAMTLSWALPWPRWLNAPSIGGGELRLATLLALLGAALSLTAGLGQKIDLARQRGHAVALWACGAALAGPTGAVLMATITQSLTLVVGASALLPAMVLGCQTAVSLGSIPRHLRPNLRIATKSDLMESMRSGGVFLGLAVVGTVSFQIDTLIVSSTLGAAAAAQFSVVVRMFTLVSSTVQGCLTQLWSAFAEALSVGDFQWVKRTIARTTLLGGGTTLVVGGVLTLFGQRLVEIWLGPAFRPTTGLLVAAASWTAYTTAVHPLVMFLNGAQLQGPQLRLAIPMALVNVAMSIYLTEEIGLAGPLIGSLLAHMVCVLWPMRLLINRRLNGQYGKVDAISPSRRYS